MEINMEDFKNLNEIMVQSEEIFDGQVLHLFEDTQVALLKAWVVENKAMK